MAFWNDHVEKVKTSLDIDESIDVQKRGWKLQRIGFFVILIVVALAAVGMFGDGIVSKRSQYRGTTLVEYNRYLRFQAPMKLRIKTPGTKHHVISFPNAYLSHFEIRSILPEPTSTSVKEGRVNYYFDGSGNLDVTFYLEPEQAGSIDGTITVDEQSFLINHYIFP